MGSVPEPYGMMICKQLDNKFNWLSLPYGFGISNTCGGVWLNVVGQNRETNEEHNKACGKL